MQETNNILRIFKDTKEAVKKGEVVKLKELSNQTIHTASTSQDPENITVAVIIYSLSKVIERGAFKKSLEFKRKILILIDKTIDSIEKNNSKQTHNNLREIRKTIEKFSGKLLKYIKDVFRKASINKASKIYEHGVSMERTACLLGITMFELASYAGQKGFEEKGEETIKVKTRLKTAMEMFE